MRLAKRGAAGGTFAPTKASKGFLWNHRGRHVDRRRRKCAQSQSYQGPRLVRSPERNRRSADYGALDTNGDKPNSHGKIYYLSALSRCRVVRDFGDGRRVTGLHHFIGLRLAD
jgi:hypothetical protein